MIINLLFIHYWYTSLKTKTIISPIAKWQWRHLIAFQDRWDRWIILNTKDTKIGLLKLCPCSMVGKWPLNVDSGLVIRFLLRIRCDPRLQQLCLTTRQGYSDLFERNWSNMQSHVCNHMPSLEIQYRWNKKKEVNPGINQVSVLGKVPCVAP